MSCIDESGIFLRIDILSPKYTVLSNGAIERRLTGREPKHFNNQGLRQAEFRVDENRMTTLTTD